MNKNFNTGKCNIVNPKMKEKDLIHFIFNEQL